MSLTKRQLAEIENQRQQAQERDDRQDAKAATGLLTDEEEALCDKMGIAYEDFLKTRKESNTDQSKKQTEFDEKIKRTFDRSNSVGGSTK